MKTKQVTKPVLEFKFPDGRIERVWVLDPGQFCELSQQRCHRFPHQPGDKTASLIYECTGPFGHEATEYNINDPGTWAWIGEWMREGLRTKGHLDCEPPTTDPVKSS